MVVIAIVIVLITMAIPKYIQNVARSREAVLKSNLYSIRLCIQRYMYDQGMAPKTLEDLKKEGYLKEIPTDPITGTNTSWRTVPEEPGHVMDVDRPGFDNIHSGSNKVALDGTHYSEW